MAVVGLDPRVGQAGLEHVVDRGQVTAYGAGEFDERGEFGPARPAQPALQQQPAGLALDRNDLPELFLANIGVLPA
ncbi:hypothetical protein GCM10009661_61220 [Catellatospora chokoriensis]|uniref:Uncharacterized protein n=1 Tax=Catellatospora chokoriensis TaxID=310353 RepID=A0A8J3K8I4_9ACTN|nr:hypothetical protein Cch02nite_82960 [Catellatospora chokoriensis]